MHFFISLWLYYIIRIWSDIIQIIFPIFYKIRMPIPETSLGNVSVSCNLGNYLYSCHIAYLTFVLMVNITIVIGILPSLVPFIVIAILNLHFTSPLVVYVCDIVNILIPTLATIITVNLACTIESFQACRANIFVPTICIDWCSYCSACGQS